MVLLFPSYARVYEGMTVTNGGTVSGFVKLQGELPDLAPPEVFKFKEVCKNVPNEELVVGPRRGIRYAVVTVEGITKGKAIEREAVNELDNRGCRFVPHVQAAIVGQWLMIKNSDPILHTAHAYFEDGQPQFNLGLFPGKLRRKPLVSPGIVKILCEVHPWMRALVVVTEHPYHGVTDIYGEYKIRDVPPGTYRLKVWHESLGTQEKQVEVKAGAASKVDFILSSRQGVIK
ncbi:MAG: carboxypeptidase regulatory-like domain-containing protein [Candidatus Binatia bacterium]